MKSEILNLRLADNFRLREFLSRDAEHMGVDPMPTAAVLEALKGTAVLLQGLRLWSGPLVVKSGYRPLDYNRAIKSSDGSYHVTGHAVDVEAVSDEESPSNHALAVAAANQVVNGKWDKVILEFFRPHFVRANGEKDGDDSGWVHLQRAKEGRDPRCQFFFAVNHEKQGGYADWVEEAAAEYRAKRNRPTGTIYIPCDAGFSTMEQF